MLRLSFVHGLSFAPVRADCYFRLFVVHVSVRACTLVKLVEFQLTNSLGEQSHFPVVRKNSETHIGETFPSNNFSYTLCDYTMS